MNNLLELVLAVIEVLMSLRTKKVPVQVTPALRDALAAIRGLALHAEPAPFETGDEALAWIRGAVQWDLVSVVVETMLGKSGASGGPLFWQGFVQAAYDAFDLAEPGKAKPDAREYAKVMIEIGQSQSQFQILRAQHFEDLVTKTLADFAAASAEE